MKEPLVSCCVRTYNQCKYVKQCIDSILMQKTDFDYEIIVADDCSSDGTAEILKEYQKNNGGKIRLLLDEHVGGTENLKRVIEASSAKYIALCDGDDYWTDTYKLQKQIDILEANPQMAGCFCNVLNRYENSNAKPNYFLPIDFPTINTWKDVVRKKWFMPINGEVFVREYVSFPEWYGKVMNDDYVMNLMIVRHGDFYYLPDVMAVYRHNEGSESNQYVNLVLINNNLKMILENTKSLYPEECAGVFDEAIDFYKTLLKKCERLQRHPWLVYLDWRFYKRAIFKALKIRRVAE